MTSLTVPPLHSVGYTGFGRLVTGPAQNAPSADTGDSVHISAKARQALATRQKSAATAAPSGPIGSGALAIKEMEQGADPTLVAKATTASGHQILLNRAQPTAETAATSGQAQDGTGDDTPSAAYTLTILDENGQQERVLDLTADTLVSENADGTLAVGNYAPGAETSGDDVIIGLHGGELRGGDGNDTIIALDSTTGSHINGGDGRDTVYVDGGAGWSGQIDTGAGNDQIVTKGLLLNSALRTGDGDDSVAASDLSAAGLVAVSDDTGDLVYAEESNSLVIDTGAGNDSVSTGSADATREGAINLDIDTGDGNDAVAAGTLHIDRGGFIRQSIATGSGDDNIRTGDTDVSWKGLIQTTIDAGDGNDRIATGTATTVWDGTIETDIDAGNGDDSVRIGDLRTEWGGAIRLHVQTGDGNDAVRTGTMTTAQGGTIASMIDTGSGGNTFVLRFMAAMRRGAA